METLAAVLFYLEFVQADNTYTFTEIETIEDKHQDAVEEVYNDEEEMEEVESEYIDHIAVSDEKDKVKVYPDPLDEGDIAF